MIDALIRVWVFLFLAMTASSVHASDTLLFHVDKAPVPSMVAQDQALKTIKEDIFKREYADNRRAGKGRLAQLLLARGDTAGAAPHLRKAAESPDPGIRTSARDSSTPRR